VIELSSCQLFDSLETCYKSGT